MGHTHNPTSTSKAKGPSKKVTKGQPYVAPSKKKGKVKK